MSPEQLETALEQLKQAIGAGQIGAAVQGLIARLEIARAGVPQWVAASEALLALNAPAAVALLDAAGRRWPTSTSLRYLLGNGLRMSGRAQEAEAALRGVIEAEPGHANASASLAYLLREQGRLSAAAQLIVDLWRNTPRSLATDLRTLLFLRECQCHAEAESLLPALLLAHPDNAQLHTFAGETALALGRFGEAQRRYRIAVDSDASQAAAWLRLAHTHKFTDPDDEDLSRLRGANARADLDVESRVCAGFGLGKALDDLGDYAGAAQTLRAANERQRARRAWDVDGWKRFVAAQVRAPDLPVAPAQPDCTPVFIVGLPRSGTTLVASLLARDRQVRNRNELNWVAAFAGHLGPSPAESALVAASRAYLSQLRQDDQPAQVYIDKNPLNFRHLALIAAMLPQARIVHCRRDLRDTGLSLWSQHFAHPDMAWAYDFADIAAYASGYAYLMRHWRERLPLPIFDLDYEALVGDGGVTLARLREFLSLPAQGESEDASEGSAITTASVWQARQKIYASSVGRWKAYLPHIAELAS